MENTVKDNIALQLLWVLLFFIRPMKTLNPCGNIAVSNPRGAATVFVLLASERFLPVMFLTACKLAALAVSVYRLIPLKDTEELSREQGKESG